MSEFWWGVLALPLIVIAASAAVAAALGAWWLFEKLATKVFGKMRPVQLPERLGPDRGPAPSIWTLGDMGQRGKWAAVLLAGGQARYVRIGPLCIAAMWGSVDAHKARIIHAALVNSLVAAAKRYEEQKDWIR